MDKDPLVSISCVTYNHAPFIRQCLEGFMMQQCNFDFEVLIHDDASTDNTQSVIREYQEKYPEIIKPIFQEENQYSKGVRGMMARFNFPRAKGKYIALCEGDDYWTDPLKLQKQVGFLEENPEYVLVGGQASRVYEAENFEKIYPPQVQKDFDFNTNFLMICNPITTLTACYKSGIVKELPELYYTGGTGGDRRFYLLLSQFGKCRFMQSNFGVYRIHKGGVSHINRTGNYKTKIEKNKRAIKHAENWNAYLGGHYDKEVAAVRRKMSLKNLKLHLANKDFMLAAGYSKQVRMKDLSLKYKGIVSLLRMLNLFNKG